MAYLGDSWDCFTYACAAIAGQILAVHNQIFSVIPATLPNDIIEQALIKAHAAAIINWDATSHAFDTYLNSLDIPITRII